MAKIEERILTMKFDNAQFKSAAADTSKALSNLKKDMKLDGVKSGIDSVAKAASDSFGKINKSSKAVNLDPIVQSVDEVKNSFTALSAISFGAFASIGASAVQKVAGNIKGAISKVTDPIVQGGMNRARNLEQANFMLSGLFSKLDDNARKSNIDQVMAAANNSVTGTAFGLDEAAKAAAQLTASQVPMEKLEGALRGIAGTASMTGSGFEEIANIFTTVAGNGRMMGQELSMLSSRGLNAAASIAEHLGVTEAEVREMSSQGKISFEIFSEAMEGAFGKQAARANETYSGSLSNLRSALGRIGADVATVYLEKMRDLFNELRPAVNAIHKALQPFITMINDRFTKSIDSALVPIKAFSTALEEFNKSGSSGSKGWDTLFNSLQDGAKIIGLIVDVMRDAVAVMFGATPRFIEMSDTVTSAGTKIQHIIRKLLSVFMLIPEIIGAILQAAFGLKGGLGSLGMSFLDIIDHVASFLYGIAEFIRTSRIMQMAIGGIGTVIRFLVEAVAAVVRVIMTVVNSVVSFITSFTPLSAVINFVAKSISEIGSIMGLLVSWIKDVVLVLMGANPRFIEMGTVVTKTGGKIHNIIRKMLSVFMLVPETIGRVVRAIFGLGDEVGALGGSFMDVIKQLGSFLGGIAGKIGTFVASIFGVTGGLGDLGNAFLDVVDRGASFLYMWAETIRESGLLKGILGGVSDAAKFLAKNVGKFGSSVVDWFGRIFDSVKKLDIKDLWKSIRSFKMPKIDLSDMKHLSKFVSSITGGFDKLKNFMGTIDWSPLTNIFTKMQMPNMGEISTLAGSIGTGIRTGMSNITADPIKNFVRNVRDNISSVVSYLRGVDYAGLWATTTATFKSGASKVAEIIGDMAVWIYEGVQSIDWAAVGKFLLDGLVSAVKMTVEAADTIATFISDMFNKAMAAIDWDGMVDGILDFGDKVKESFSTLFDNITGKTVDTSALENSINSVPTDLTVNVKKDLDAQTKGLRDTIGDFFGALFGTGPVIDPEESEIIAGVGTFGSAISNISTKLSSPFASAKKAVTAEFTGFGTTLKNATTGFLEAVDLVGVLNGIGIAFAGAGIHKLAGSVEQLAAVPTALKGALDAMGASFKSIGEAAKIEAQGNAILKIAASLAIMAAAVWFLSKIPWDQMKVGLGAVMTLLAGLVASVVIMDKTISDEGSEKIDSLANSMMKLGVAIGIMAAAVWILGNMDPATIIQGFLAALGSVIILAGGAAIAGMTKSLAGMGTAFMGLALGVAILAGAFILFKFINWADIAKGLTTLGVAVLAISFAARIADGKKLAGAGLAMLGLGTGLFALAFGLKAIADLDEQQLTQGLLVLGGVMLAITGMSRYGGKLTATTGALVGVAFAMIGLAYAIGLIANIDFWAAAGGMAVIVGGMVGLGWAMKAFPKDMPAIAGSLLGIAGAIAILVAAIWVIGNMDPTVVGQGVAVLAGALLSLSLALKYMKPTAGMDMLVLAGGMVALAGSMLILAFAMKMFNDVDWSSLGKAALVLVVLVGVVALMGFFGEAAAVGVTALGIALAILGAGLLVIAGAVWVFADAVAKIIDSLNTLKDSGTQIKDALEEVGKGITLFADEAKSGLETLFETIGLTDLPKIGSLVKLFKSFSTIPEGMEGRLSGLGAGLEALQGGIPVLEKLKDLSAANSGALRRFFETFGGIDADAGTSLATLSDTIKSFDDDFFGILESLAALDIPTGKSHKLADFFNAFDGIHPEAGDKLKSLTDTLRSFDDDFFGILGQITGLEIPNDQAGLLKDFFNAFDGIHHEAGDKLKSLTDTMRSFDQGFFDILGKMTGLEIPTNTSIQLKTFFNAFDGIHHEAGDKLKSLTDTMRGFDQTVFDNIASLAGLSVNVVTAINLALFFNAFDGIHHDAGSKLSAVVGAIKSMDTAFFTAMGSLAEVNVSSRGLSNFLKDLGENTPKDLGVKLSGAVSGIRMLAGVIPDLKKAISGIEKLNVDGLSNVMSNIDAAFSSGVGDGIKGAADAISAAVTAMLSAITDRSSDFSTAGQGLGTNLAEGVESADGEARSAGTTIGDAAADGAKEARSKMVASGKYIAAGLAQGIRDGAEEAVNAARDMANRVAAASRVALDEHSPSRVFVTIGEFVSQGFAIGITNDAPLATKAIEDSMDSAIDAANGKTGELKGATGGFYDTLLKDFNNNPMTKRLEVLARHSKAAHATAVKERKIEDAEKLEKAEEERKSIYKELEESRKAIAEAKEETVEAQKETSKKEQSADDAAKESAKAAKDAIKQKEKISDAEERYQKALRERDKYEYRMHGEEAGVAFVDGVAVGLMDDQEAIPTIAEILSELLLGEAEDLKTNVSDVTDIFGGFDKVLKTTSSMGDNVRDLTRAFSRLDRATSPRSIRRNIETIFESIVGFMGGIQELIGVLSILEPFLPGLLGMFEANLPAIIAAVAPFAPELAATMGGGLTAALPAILGPAAAIIAGVAGIGIFLADQANGGGILKGLEKAFKGVVKFAVGLPRRILGGFQVLLKGLKQTFLDLPRLMTTIVTGVVDLIVGIIEVIPDIIPELVNSIIEIVAWIILNAPGLLLEVGAALITGLYKGLDRAVRSMLRILLTPFMWLTGQIGGSIDLFAIAGTAIQRLGAGFDAMLKALLELILWPFTSLFNAIGKVFGFDKLGSDLVIGFKNAIIAALGLAIDVIVQPFIGLYNIIAAIFGWEPLAFNAASSFIFGTTKALDEGAEEVGGSAQRVSDMMNRYMKTGAQNNLADVRGYVDDYMDLVSRGMVNGVSMGADATRDVADKVWADIEKTLDMAGLGKDEIKALTDSFYEGTTNPATIVSSFNKVFAEVEKILALDETGTDMIADLDKSLYDALEQGLLDNAMAEFGNVGYQSGGLLTDGIVKGMDLSKSQIENASDEVWANISAVFDFAGLGQEGVDELRAAYEDGTRNPDTYVSTFDKVFDAVEKKLLLAGVGTDQIQALRNSMSTAIQDELNPKLKKDLNKTGGIFEGVMSEKNGKSMGEDIVQGIVDGITSPFRDLFGIAVGIGQKISNGILSGVGAVRDFGADIIGKFVGGITDLKWKLYNAGSDIVEGLTDGISGVIGNVFGAASALAERLWKEFAKVLGIRSPSRKFMEGGKFIVQGLAKGLDDNGGLAEDSMSHIGDDILDVARTIVDEIAAAMEAEADYTISPVLDLTDVKKGAKNISSMVGSAQLSLDTAVSGTSDLASVIPDGEAMGGNITNITNVEFNQTNTSPEPLSAYEIYQNTDRSLTTLKLSGPNR